MMNGALGLMEAEVMTPTATTLHNMAVMVQTAISQTLIQNHAAK